MGIFDFIFNRKKAVSVDQSPPPVEHIPIYETPPLEMDSIERSDLFAQRHQKNIQNFESYSDDDVLERPLTPKELAFLKYIGGKTPERIAGYWTHEANLNISQVLRELLASEYIKFSVYPDEHLRVEELKGLLASKNISTSGKRKKDLLNLFHEVYTDDEINQLNFEKTFNLTDKGLRATEAIPLSLTQDHVFDKRCLDLILDNKLEQVYIEICRHEAAKPTPRGLGIDWEVQQESSQIENYFKSEKKVFNAIKRVDALPNKQDNKLFNALHIYAHMLGKSSISDKLIADWIPNFKQRVSVEELHNACLLVQEEYEYYKYAPYRYSEAKLDKAYIEYLIARIYKKAGRTDKVVPRLEKVVALNWDGDRPYQELINLYESVGMPAASRRIRHRLAIVKEGKRKDLMRTSW